MEYLWFGLHCLIYSLSSIIYRALVLSIPNVFGCPSSLCSRAVLLSHVSSLIPPYAAAPGFITPSSRYEPNLNNVAAPHLIGRLISERTRALIKNKPKSNGSGGHRSTRMGRKTCASTRMHV